MPDRAFPELPWSEGLKCEIYLNAPHLSTEWDRSRTVDRLSECWARSWRQTLLKKKGSLGSVPMRTMTSAAAWVNKTMSVLGLSYFHVYLTCNFFLFQGLTFNWGGNIDLYLYHIQSQWWRCFPSSPPLNSIRNSFRSIHNFQCHKEMKWIDNGSPYIPAIYSDNI